MQSISITPSPSACAQAPTTPNTLPLLYLSHMPCSTAFRHTINTPIHPPPKNTCMRRRMPPHETHTYSGPAASRVGDLGEGGMGNCTSPRLATRPDWGLSTAMTVSAVWCAVGVRVKSGVSCAVWRVVCSRGHGQAKPSMTETHTRVQVEVQPTHFAFSSVTIWRVVCCCGAWCYVVWTIWCHVVSFHVAPPRGSPSPSFVRVLLYGCMAVCGILVMIQSCCIFLKIWHHQR